MVLVDALSLQTYSQTPQSSFYLEQQPRSRHFKDLGGILAAILNFHDKQACQVILHGFNGHFIPQKPTPRHQHYPSILYSSQDLAILKILNRLGLKIVIFHHFSGKNLAWRLAHWKDHEILLQKSWSPLSSTKCLAQSCFEVAISWTKQTPIL